MTWIARNQNGIEIPIPDQIMMDLLFGSKQQEKTQEIEAAPDESPQHLRRKQRSKSEIRRISREVKSRLKENPSLKISEAYFDICKTLDGLTSIYAYLPKSMKKGRGNHKVDYSRKSHPKAAERMRFICSRTNALMKQFNYSRQKAMRIAASEYASKGKTITLNTYPDILPDSTLNKALMQALAQVAQDNSTFNWKQHGSPLFAMNWAEFRDLCQKIIAHSKSISDHLNVPDKWAVKLDGLEIFVQYG